jgi:hypothetical protein
MKASIDEGVLKASTLKVTGVPTPGLTKPPRLSPMNVMNRPIPKLFFRLFKRFL